MNNTQEFQIIKQVLDKYFDFMNEIDGCQSLIEFIPEVMVNENKEHDDEYAYWIPIPSTVSEKEIADLEYLFQHSIPKSFAFFLCQKHFVELQLGGHGVNFFSNLPGELTSKFEEIIGQLYWTVLKRNYLPFAHFGDFGVLCFDASIPTTNNDYPIIILDHDDGYTTPEFYAHTFLDLFKEFDSNLEEFIKNNREKRGSI